MPQFDRTAAARGSSELETRLQQQIRRQADRAEYHPDGTRFALVPTPADDLADRDPLVAEAVLEAKRGNQDAIRFLYTRYSGNVYGYALAKLRNPDDAEDVTQQVFVKLMANLHRYEPRRVPFAAWIIRLARNVAVDKMRERREVPCDEVHGPGVTNEDRVTLTGRDLRAALNTLPDDQRRVVVLRHMRGLSPAEVGRELDKTQPSVHGLHNRGRKALKGELRRLGVSPEPV